MDYNKTIIFDIETYAEIFLLVCLIPGEPVKRFEVSRWKNELDAMRKFIEEHRTYHWVGFNSLSFDSQVIEWILRTMDSWVDLSGLEIASRIARYGSDRIDDARFDIFPPYREEELFAPQIDLFLIHHLNNKNRMTSLKALEFYMCMENIEETPVPFSKKELTRGEAVEVIHYCLNDVKATRQLFLLTVGETENRLYRGEDKIADRVAMEEEFGLKCLNWDDVRIGAEWNKMDYLRLSGKSEKDLKPEHVKHFFGKRFRQFFPKWVRFQTPELRQFVREFGDTFVLNQKQEFRFRFNEELTATIAKGGIHSTEGGRFIKPSDKEIYWQCDIGSQYPNAIRKYKVEPTHLPGWNKLIVSKIDRRLTFKNLYKETGDRKYNSLQKMGKLSLNGGSYGRLNLKGDWQEYPWGMLQVTIGGQLELLMITEDLLLKGFRVISLNTDGFDAIVPRERDQEFQQILKDWEKVIGNEELGNFELTEFQWIAQTSVNDYLALKSDGKIKAKGDFEVDKELHKNPSARIIPLALEEYFVRGIAPEEFIPRHSNIYDFCLRQKASRDFHYEGIGGGKTTVYNKLIRYYIAREGEKLLKIKNDESLSGANRVTQVNAGEYFAKVCNHLPKNTPTKEVNFAWYIEQTRRIIHKVENGSRKFRAHDPLQLTLF